MSRAVNQLRRQQRRQLLELGLQVGRHLPGERAELGNGGVVGLGGGQA